MGDDDDDYDDYPVPDDDEMAAFFAVLKDLDKPAVVLSLNCGPHCEPKHCGCEVCHGRS